MRTVLFSFFVLTTLLSQGQKRITIEDPEIAFSLDLPKKWKTKNDEYYFFVMNPKLPNARLAITYFNESTPRELEEIVDTRKKFSYSEIPGYRHLSTESTSIDGVEALVVSYLSKAEKTKIRNEEYIFLKEGQVFYLLISWESKHEEKELEKLREVTRSFSCTYR